MNSPAAQARIQKAEKELQQLGMAYAELATDASLTAAALWHCGGRRESWAVVMER